MNESSANTSLIRELEDDIVQRAIDYKAAVEHGQFGAVEPAKKALWDVIEDYEKEIAE